MDGDYVVINRKILQWEWFKNANTFHVFVYCLLKANWKDGRFEGVEVPRGTFVTSLHRLTTDLGMSVREVRTALNHLKSTNELTIQATPKYSVITVNNYDLYQPSDKVNDKQATNKRQSSDKVATNKRQSSDKVATTIEEGNKGIKEEGNKGIREECIKEKGSEKESPNENMVTMFKRLSADYSLSDPLYDKLKEWFEYKQERKQVYKEIGMKGLLKRASDYSRQYGDMKVCDLIDDSISSNWNGIIWENIDRPRGRQSLAERWRNA